MTPQLSYREDHFATARWSVVMRTASTDAADAQLALAELAQRYWYPVYAYLRHRGHDADIADHIARSLLAALMHDVRESRGSAARGHFRRYLLERVHACLEGNWYETVEPRGIEALVAPPDLESRYQTDQADAATPEDAFQRSFALEVIVRALRRLQSEAARTGHRAMYAALEPFLARDPVPGEMDAASQSLSSRPLALGIALRRLRQRLRELVGEELVDTVTSPDELAAEQVALHAILTRRHLPP